MEFDNYIFDLYGTLVDVRTNEHADETWEKWLQWLDEHDIRHPELEVFRREFFVEDKKARQKLLAEGNCTVPEIDIINVYREMFERYGNGVLGDDVLLELSYAFRVASREYIRLFPGVEEYLAKIRNSGSHAYILSNAQASYTEPEIKMFGLDKMVDDYIMSSDFKCMKPDVKFFDALMDRHHMDRSRTVMHGDSEASDIAGARAAGIASVHLVGNNHPVHYYLDRLAEGKGKMMNTINDKQKEMMAAGISGELSTEIMEAAEDVRYGTLTHVTYYSHTCEKERGMNILLPADYTKEKKYPVLYILHGIFGDEYSMCGDGKSGIPVLIGNLISKGEAKEMIVVFPFMYASKTQDQCTAIDISNVLAYDNFVNELANDIMPYMAANYSVLCGKENSAITGFSMGGRESLAVALYRPELFKYVGSIAPAPGLVYGVDSHMEHPGQFEREKVAFGEEKPELLMLCSGDKDSVVGTFPKSYHELFETNGVEHIWWEIPGSDHGDPAISSGIMNFVTRIFK